MAQVGREAPLSTRRFNNFLNFIYKCGIGGRRADWQMAGQDHFSGRAAAVQ